MFSESRYLRLINETNVRYWGAGHPPLLVVGRLNGEARSIEQNGLFLGKFSEAVYSIEIPLQQGDRYLLFNRWPARIHKS